MNGLPSGLQRLLASFLAVGIAILVPGGTASGLDVRFTRIANSCTAVPGGTGTLSDPRVPPSVDAAGNVVFGTNEGIYTGSGGPVSAVADTSTPVPGGTGNFSFDFQPFATVPSYDGTTVVFRANDSVSGLPGIYAHSGGPVSALADTTTPIPGGAGNFTSFGQPSVDGGAYGFAVLDLGVYLDTGGGLAVVADTSTIVPGSGGSPFTSFSDSLIGGPRVDAGAIQFLGNTGSYVGSGGPLTILWDQSTVLPGATAPGIPLSFSASFEAGQSVFIACESWTFYPYFDCLGANGLYRGSGGPLATVFDANTPLPGGGGYFDGFVFGNLGFSAQDAGRIAFVARSEAGTEGIYLDDAGVKSRIVVTGDELDGMPFGGFDLGPESFAGDFVAFLAEGTGMNAIYRAELGVPPVEPPLADVPVGTIVAWHKDLAGTPALPVGWEEADGSFVIDGMSPLDGVKLPDLNGGRRFLRGGACSGAVEEDQFQAHYHATTCCPEKMRMGSAFTSDPNPAFNQVDSSPATFQVGDPIDIGYGLSVADETRPDNQSVVWILKTRPGAILPVGSIIPWHGDFPNTPALPPGWFPFDGTTMIGDGGVYHGTTLPDWNGEGRFLRGGAASGVAEPHAFQGHRHSSTHDADVFFGSDVVGSGDVVDDFPANVEVQAPITAPGFESVRYGSETRPDNMSVTWLLKTSATTLPTGAILAWHPDLGPLPALPGGTVRLDGSVLDDPLSPYDGQTLPDLNGARLFLRGGTTSGVIESDEFQGHGHGVLADTTREVKPGNAWGGGAGPVIADQFPATLQVTSPTPDGVSGTPRYGNETRPDNMSVVWLMKVTDPIDQVAVPPDAAGALGGSGAVGGVDFSFNGASPGTFSAAYDSLPLAEAGSVLSSPGSVDFILPTDPVQFWELDFDAAFTDVTLTFGYDDSGFAPFFNEGSLIVYHYVQPTSGCTPGADCDWVPLATTVDTVANTVTVTTTSFSQFLLGSPSLGVDSSQWLFSGVAQGGSIDFTVGAVFLSVVTTAGQSAAQVAQAVADAINADPTLADAGITATAAGRKVAVSGVVTSSTINDAGISHGEAFPIPLLPAGFALLLAGALAAAIRGRLQARRSPGGSA